MPLDDLHREVASIALGAAAGHGFALGGGNALIVHGIIDRPTQDLVMWAVKLSIRELSHAASSACGQWRGMGSID
jgi:hypothetical protein